MKNKVMTNEDAAIAIAKVFGINPPLTNIIINGKRVFGEKTNWGNPVLVAAENYTDKHMEGLNEGESNEQNQN